MIPFSALGTKKGENQERRESRKERIWWRAILGCVRLDHFVSGTIAQFLHDEIGDLASS
jgi:succinate dehydrogenase flavin-adding protein (antitoxin of CptAB toxin-antitoxin module)